MFRVTLLFLATYCCVVFARSNPFLLDDSRSPWNNLEGAMATPLLDGILVTQGKELRAQVTDWTVLVTLEPPETPTPLLERATALENFLHRSNVSHLLTNTTLTAWNTRLFNLRTSLSPSMPLPNINPRPSRARRGLLDFGGHLLQELFGVATMAEVEKYRRIVKDVRREERAIVHKQAELITIVNKTRRDIEVNRNRLNNITEFLVDVTEKLEDLRGSFVYMRKIVNQLHFEAEINRALTILEHAAQEYVESRNLFFSQRASLELGKLTEVILPVDVLFDILNKGTALDVTYIQNIYWYYQHIVIEPIWSQMDSLLYVVKLPLINSDSFLTYSIKTWPTPLNNSHYSAQLDVNSVVALHTGDGGLFYPHSCIGSEPVVCLTGPVYFDNKERCTRGILSGNELDRKSCPVSVTAHNSTSAMIYVRDALNYVITSWGESCSLRCSGQREVTFYLDPGTYNIIVQSNCSMSGEGWRIDGLTRHTSNIVIQPSKIESIAPFQFDNLLPDLHSLQKFDHPLWDKLGEIEKLNLKPLPVSYDYVKLPMPQNIQWPLICVLIVLTLCLIGVTIVCVLKRPLNISWRRSDHKDVPVRTADHCDEKLLHDSIQIPPQCDKQVAQCMCTIPDLDCAMHLKNGRE